MAGAVVGKIDLEKPEAKKQKIEIVSSEKQQQEIDKKEEKMEEAEKPKKAKRPIYIDSEDEDDYDPELEKEYRKQVYESDGFDVGCFPTCIAGIYPLLNLETDVTAYPLKDLTCAALDEYNKKNSANMEFVKIVKATWELVKGFMYYITFEAKDATDGQNKTFQGKVWYFKFNEPPIQVQFCRLKQAPLDSKKVNEEFMKLQGKQIEGY